MEDTLIASYVTLIIGYLIKDNKVRNGILERLDRTLKFYVCG